MKLECNPNELRELLHGSNEMRCIGQLVLLDNGADLFVPQGIDVSKIEAVPKGARVINVYAMQADLVGVYP